MTLDELSHPDIPGANVRLNLLKKGADQATEQIIQSLVDLKVLRVHMFWPGWYVIYTEDGPIDIRHDQLLGKNS